MKLSESALSCDRTGVSDRAAVLITSSIIIDITPFKKDGETSLDRSKVKRERVKMRTSL